VTGRPRPNFRLARPLFIMEVGASFVHSLIISATRGKSVQVLEENLLQLGMTSRRVLGLCLGISWLSSALLFHSEGVEEDLLLCFWSIYIKEVFARFLPREGFPR
jgi:hypothetical protein